MTGPGNSTLEGPLGQLWRPESPEEQALPREPLHARVLQLPASHGLELVVVQWESAGSAAQMFDLLQARIEGALLALLSAPAQSKPDDQDNRDEPLALQGIHLAAPRGSVQTSSATLRPFALEPVLDVPSLWARLAPPIRHEAQRVGLELEKLENEEQPQIWTAQVQTPATELWQIEQQIRRATRGAPFGQQPGRLYAALREAAQQAGHVLPPTLPGLETAEQLVGSRQTSCIRWIFPATFQALCDMVGVVASHQLGASMQWAVCEAEEDGLAPPPLLRWDSASGGVHIPIGLHAMRWLIIPLQPHDEVPPLAAWVHDQFGNAHR